MPNGGQMADGGKMGGSSAGLLGNSRKGSYYSLPVLHSGFANHDHLQTEEVLTL